MQSTGLIDVDEYTRSYSDVSPIICEENHISRPFYTRNNFPYKSPSDLQRDITNSKLSTDDPSAELIRAIELQQHHTTSSLYGSIEQLQRIATIIRIGQTLETDDEIYKLHAHDIL